MITFVNGSDRSWTKHLYVLCFGAYGGTKLAIYANHLDGALDAAIDWLADNAPGHICDEVVTEAYNEAIGEGKSEEEAQQYAESDMTQGGSGGNYIVSHEWGVLAEDPTRAEILAMVGEA